MIVLRVAESRADIAPELGGRLVQLDLGDGPVLRGHDEGLGWAEWGCYPLLPWSNRIPGGRLTFGDLDAQLPVNWPDGSAIHGLVASCPWEVDAATADAVSLVVEAAAGPYRVRGEQRYELSPELLRVTLTVVNLGDDAVPVGLGIHPWFRSGPIRVPAARKWPGDPLPVGPSVPVDGDDDLRAMRVPPLMDRCFTGLSEPTVDVPGVTLRARGPITHVVVYTGVADWVAVEPVTMANDGFGLASRGFHGHGVQVLDPGGKLSVEYSFKRRPYS